MIVPYYWASFLTAIGAILLSYAFVILIRWAQGETVVARVKNTKLQYEGHCKWAVYIQYFFTLHGAEYTLLSPVPKCTSVSDLTENFQSIRVGGKQPRLLKKPEISTAMAAVIGIESLVCGLVIFFCRT